MTKKNKYKRSGGFITCMFALSTLAAVWLLMLKLAVTAEQTVTEYQPTEFHSSPDIRLVEIVNPSVHTEKAAKIYDATIPATESPLRLAKVAVVDDLSFAEVEAVEPEWVYPLTDDELRLVALIAEKEDRNAMAEIAETILNRVLSPKFPDSVKEVIYQKRQFHTVRHINDNMTPSDGAVEAVIPVFKEGETRVNGAIFFAEKSVPKEKIARNLYLAAEAGSTRFYGQR